MECSVYDSTLSRIGFLSNFTSLVWGESYTGAGRFQVVSPKTAHSISLLADGNFVGIPGKDTLMFIQSTEDKEGMLWAYGSEAKCLLDSRVYAGTITCRKEVETALRSAVQAARPYDFLGLAPLRGLTGRTISQRTYPTVFEVSRAWCETVGYGFRLIHDKTAHKLLYDVYEGVERTGIKFAEQYGNLSGLTKLVSQAGWRNVAYVGGAGEGSERIFVTTGETDASGIARREMFVDARDLQPEEGQTDDEYTELLRSRGNEKLAEQNRVLEISFDVSTQDFGKRFFLGDKITAVLPEYGMRLMVRVAEFTEIYENNILRTQLTLGNPMIRGL